MACANVAALALVLACNPAAPGSTPRQDAAGTTAAIAGDTAATAADAEAAALAAIRRGGNHLRDEPSPYLQQHHRHSGVGFVTPAQRQYRDSIAPIRRLTRR
jgi:hypothetical protein